MNRGEAKSEVGMEPKDRWADIGQACTCTWIHSKNFGIHTSYANAKIGVHWIHKGFLGGRTRILLQVAGRRSLVGHMDP